jgi:hypothetical protein
VAPLSPVKTMIALLGHAGLLQRGEDAADFLVEA